MGAILGSSFLYGVIPNSSNSTLGRQVAPLGAAHHSLAHCHTTACFMTDFGCCVLGGACKVHSFAACCTVGSASGAVIPNPPYACSNKIAHGVSVGNAFLGEAVMTFVLVSPLAWPGSTYTSDLVKLFGRTSAWLRLEHKDTLDTSYSSTDA